MIQLSTVIITYNEEKNIERCIESVQNISDEILVVDSFSTDKTPQICEAKGVRFLQNPFEGHVEQKNFAMQQATYPYILSLDADEALDQKLQAAIAQVKQNWTKDGYSFSRLTNYCGQWIRHGGWYPDEKIRLWERSKGKWGGVNPHDKVILEKGNSTTHLKGDLLHYSFHSIRQHLEVVNKYSEIGAQEAFKKGKKGSLFKILANPSFRFFRGYILQRGFMDGYYGLVIAIISSFATFVKYVKLRELRK